MFNIMPLFASSLYSYTVDPCSYDKQNIINTIVNNYEKSPVRNSWDNISRDNVTYAVSNIHHYYNDWDNKEFDNVDLSSLVNVYEQILPEFLSFVGLGEELNFKFKVNNITVYNDNTQYMNEHHHYGTNNTLFSTVHYLQADETSSPITFTNPSSFFIYPDIKMLGVVQSSINKTNAENSMFFDYWSVPVKEDQIIIFPSWLKHKVMSSSIKPERHRIAVVTNIHLVYD